MWEKLCSRAGHAAVDGVKLCGVWKQRHTQWSIHRAHPHSTLTNQTIMRRLLGLSIRSWLALRRCSTRTITWHMIQIYRYRSYIAEEVKNRANHHPSQTNIYKTKWPITEIKRTQYLLHINIYKLLAPERDLQSLLINQCLCLQQVSDKKDISPLHFFVNLKKAK